MKCLALSTLFLAASLMVDAAAHAQRRGGSSATAARNGWLFSLSEGIKQAQKSGKPLMVVLRCEP